MNSIGIDIINLEKLEDAFGDSFNVSSDEALSFCESEGLSLELLMSALAFIVPVPVTVDEMSYTAYVFGGGQTSRSSRERGSRRRSRSPARRSATSIATPARTFAAPVDNSMGIEIRRRETAIDLPEPILDLQRKIQTIDNAVETAKLMFNTLYDFFAGNLQASSAFAGALLGVALVSFLTFNKSIPVYPFLANLQLIYLKSFKFPLQRLRDDYDVESALYATGQNNAYSTLYSSVAITVLGFSTIVKLASQNGPSRAFFNGLGYILALAILFNVEYQIKIVASTSTFLYSMYQSRNQISNLLQAVSNLYNVGQSLGNSRSRGLLQGGKHLSLHDISAFLTIASSNYVIMMLTTLKPERLDSIGLEGGAVPKTLVYVFTMWMVFSVFLFAIQCAGSGLPSFFSLDETSLFSYIVTSIVGPLSYLSTVKTIINKIFKYVLQLTGLRDFFDLLTLAQVQYRQGDVEGANTNVNNALLQLTNVKWSVIAGILGSLLPSIAKFFLEKSRNMDVQRSVKELSDVLKEIYMTNKSLLEGAQERANQINQVVSAQQPSAQRTAARSTTAPLRTTLPPITPNFRRQTIKDLNG